MRTEMSSAGAVTTARPLARRQWPVVATLVLAWVAVAAPALAQEAEKPPALFVMDDRPSLRFGDVLRLDFTTRLDGAYRNVDTTPDDDWDFDHRRVGLEGRFLRVIGFEVERELRNEDQPWRDVFAELRKWRAFRVRGGRFKLPFGRERLTSIVELPFVYRSLASVTLTPARDTGLEVNGRFTRLEAGYMAGVFRHDGDVSRGGTDEPGGTTVAGRFTLAPLSGARAAALRRLEVGVGFTAGDVAEGLNGLHAEALDGFVAIEPHYVRGRRVRLGADAAWEDGPVAVQAEFLQARDERGGQGLRGEDLPDVIGRGGYVSGTWTIVGALRANRYPRRGLFDGGPGAIQIAARAEWLGFRSAGAAAEAPFRNPRATRILENDITSSTVGVNWYPVRFVRLQFNLVRERIDDPERRPDPAQAVRYARVLRIQFAM
jgi:phosphate-selective porin